jgi:hypothetical protein
MDLLDEVRDCQLVKTARATWRWCYRSCLCRIRFIAFVGVALFSLSLMIRHCRLIYVHFLFVFLRMIEVLWLEEIV